MKLRFRKTESQRQSLENQISPSLLLEPTFEMSVKKGPATMQLARTLGPKATARAMVKLFKPALAAAYGISMALGLIEAVEETLMMLPPVSCLAIWVPKRAERRKGPFKFTPMTFSQ